MTGEALPDLAGFPIHRRLHRVRRGWSAAVLLLFATAAGLALAGRSREALFAAAGAAGAGILAAAHAARIRKGLAPADPDAELLRGMRLLLANDRFAAEAAFREILARNPADVEATLYLGLVLREHGDTRGSAKVLSRALRIDVARKWTREIQKLLLQADAIK